MKAFNILATRIVGITIDSRENLAVKSVTELKSHLPHEVHPNSAKKYKKLDPFSKQRWEVWENCALLIQ